MTDEHRGERISYMVVVAGTRVEDREGVEIGTVKRVLADEGTDIFDGLILDTPDGDRFVDAPQVGELYTRVVILDMTAAEAQTLPEPTPSPATVDLSAEDVASDESAGDKVRDAARRAWDRISGNYYWPPPAWSSFSSDSWTAASSASEVPGGVVASCVGSGGVVVSFSSSFIRSGCPRSGPVNRVPQGAGALSNECQRSRQAWVRKGRHGSASSVSSAALGRSGSP